tara:strand:- start:1680 stop:1799 length:120 start_codon:yes stop_codon:yes gene_type:complete
MLENIGCYLIFKINIEIKKSKNVCILIIIFQSLDFKNDN